MPSYANAGYPVDPRPGTLGTAAYVYSTGPASNPRGPYDGAGSYVPPTAAPLNQRGFVPREFQESQFAGYPPPMGRGDVPMSGMDDGYDDRSPVPPGPPGRIYPPREQPHDRHSPDSRDPYRPKPAREERRQRNR